VLLREKVVAESGRRLAIDIDDSKLSAKLGTQKSAPVEVVEFEWRRLADFLQSLGPDPTSACAQEAKHLLRIRASSSGSCMLDQSWIGLRLRPRFAPEPAPSSTDASSAWHPV
jgi:ribose 5-phosphate isomerase